MRLFSILCLFFIFLCSCTDKDKQYNGYIDADLIYLSSNFPGRIADLFIERGQAVDKGKLLFKVEQTDSNYTVEMSELAQKSTNDQRKQIISQLNYASRNYQRVTKMHRQDAASQNDLELAKKELDVLQDQLAAINTQVRSSALNTADKKWARDHKEGYANQEGIIFDTYFAKDEYVQPGQPILSLLTAQQIKVVFYVPEPKLNSIKLNGKINILSSNQPVGSGTISYIAKIAQYTPPIIYSREESHNLVFRVEARLEHPDLTQIHLGQPISLELLS